MELNQELCGILRKYARSQHRDLSVDRLVDIIKRHSSPPSGRRLTFVPSAGQDGFWSEILRYNYKRDCLVVSVPVEARPFFFYGFQVDDYWFNLLNSGQAGLNIALLYILRTFPNKSVSLPTAPYVGTSQLLSLYNIPTTKSLNCDILWLCSSTATEVSILDVLQSEKKWELVVIDTTCWDHADLNLHKILKTLSGFSSVICIRSYSKLDMAGVEYGSLGGVFAINNLRKLDLDLLDLLFKLTASAPSLDDIPPYLFDDLYSRLLSKRNALLSHNTAEFRDQISGWSFTYFEFGFPEHMKYFYITIDDNIFNSIKDWFLATFVRLLKMNECEARACPSFGFDFITISDIHADNNRGRVIFRIAPGLQKEGPLALVIAFKEIEKKLHR